MSVRSSYLVSQSVSRMSLLSSLCQKRAPLCEVLQYPQSWDWLGHKYSSKAKVFSTAQHSTAQRLKIWYLEQHIPSSNLEPDLFRLKSQLCCLLLTLWPWAISLISLCLCMSISKIRIVSDYLIGLFVRIKLVNIFKALRWCKAWSTGKMFGLSFLPV